MSLDALDGEARAKLKRVLEQGIKTHTEVTLLRDSMRDLVKAVAEELDVKPKLINKAIRSAIKVSIDEEKEDLDTVEDILTVSGKR